MQWLPAEPAATARSLALIERNDAEFKFHLDRYKYPNRYDGAVAEEHRSKACGFLEELEDILREQPFLHGSHRGLADAAIMPFIRQFANTDETWFTQAPFPQLQRWLAQELASPSFTGVMQKYPQWHEGDAELLFPDDDTAS